MADVAAKGSDAKATIDELRAEHAAEIAKKSAELAQASALLAAKTAEFDTKSAELTANVNQFAEKAAALEARERELSRKAEHAVVAEAHRKKVADQLAMRESELEEAHRMCDQLVVQVAELEKAQAAGAAAASTEELSAITRERDDLAEHARELEKRLHAAEQAAAEAAMSAGSASGEGEANAELQQRFEMAMQDLREQKARNDDLEQRLAQARRSAASNAPVSSEGFDWEAQKRKMLASLDDDYSEESEQDRHDRMAIEDTIRITDQALAQKDQEIYELKDLLQNQSSNLGSVAVGAAAIAQLLDQDELITQERERLRVSQEEWREKLRAAEVELSVERAKIARERMMLEDKFRQFEEQAANRGPADTGQGQAGAGDDGKGKRRWLSRLGIRDTDTNR